MPKPMLVLSILLAVPACSDDNGPAPVAAAGSSSANAGAGGGAGAGGSSAGAGGGGAAGTGGSAGAGGAGSLVPPSPSLTYAFASSLDGFAVNYFCTAPGICASATPQQPPPVLADAGSDAGNADAGESDGGSPPGGLPFYALTHDSAVGSPDVGSARLAIQFNGPGQLVDFALNIPTVNLTNKLLKAQVRLEAGGPATTAKMYIKTGATYVYADSGQANLVEGTWVSLAYPNVAGGGYISNVVAYDPVDTREIGIEIAAGPASLAPAIVHIDTVAY